MAAPGSLPRSFAVAGEIASGRPLSADLTVTAKQIKQGSGIFTGTVVRYSATAPGETKPVMSLIEKTLVQPALPVTDIRPAWQGWNREAYVYTDAAFCADVRGIRFPHCYLIEIISEREIRLFLEDLGHLVRVQDSDDYMAVSTALGRFGAKAHADRTWQRPWLANTEAPIAPPDNFARLRVGIRFLFPDKKFAESLERDFALLLGKLHIARRLWDLLPPTVVHGDAHQGNCFMREDGSEIVFCDLSQVSRGPAGFDLVTLVNPLAQLILRHIRFAECEELAAGMRGAYLAGWSSCGVALDPATFNAYYNVQVALNCARILSRPRMVEAWMTKRNPGEEAGRRRKVELTLFFESLAKTMRSLGGGRSDLALSAR